jgi:GH43 family beta-xylosidase
MSQADPTPEALLGKRTYTNPVYKGYFADPFVWEHEGVYYAIGTGAAEAEGKVDEVGCFYSGGCWETENYGVDYGVADSVMGLYSDARNEAGPRVLKTVPGYVLGPGHNSLAIDPDGQTDYIAYHAWDTDKSARRMCVDKLNLDSGWPALRWSHLDSADCRIIENL